MTGRQAMTAPPLLPPGKAGDIAGPELNDAKLSRMTA
jgi:hypothetical protein